MIARLMPMVLVAAGGLTLGAATPSVSQAAPAVWRSTAARLTGAVTMAAATYKFSGANAASYTIAFTVLNFADTDYPVLTNTGPTAASFTGVVTAPAGLPLGSAVQVRSCAVAWTGSTCPGGATSLLPSTALAPPPAISYQANPIPSGGKVYLQVKVSGFLATTSVTLTVTKGTLPVGGTNRTNG